MQYLPTVPLQEAPCSWWGNGRTRGCEFSTKRHDACWHRERFSQESWGARSCCEYCSESDNVKFLHSCLLCIVVINLPLRAKLRPFVAYYGSQNLLRQSPLIHSSSWLILLLWLNHLRRGVGISGESGVGVAAWPLMSCSSIPCLCTLAPRSSPSPVPSVPFLRKEDTIVLHIFIAAGRRNWDGIFSIHWISRRAQNTHTPVSAQVASSAKPVSISITYFE